jgi:CysZ protein
MFASAGKAIGMIFDPAFRGVVLKGLFLTILLFVGVFVGLKYGLDALPPLPWGWANDIVDVLEWIVAGGVGFILLPIFIGAPIAAIFASFFLDEVSAAVEKKHYPSDPPAHGTPFLTGLWIGIRFLLILIVVNLILLPFNLFPLTAIFAWVITIVVNGWLLGREYFELAAVRHMKLHDADVLRRKHSGALTMAGIVIALLAFIPIVSFFAPLFGVAYMALIFKRYQHLGLAPPDTGTAR